MSVDPKFVRTSILRYMKDGTISAHDGQTCLSLCDVAERHHRHLNDTSQPVPFMGLGELTPVFTHPDDGNADWFFTSEVLLITGATIAQWKRLRDEEITESADEPAVTPRVDTIDFHLGDGTTHSTAVCNWQMAMLLALDGPWGNELMGNVMPAFRKAAVQSGIAQKISVVRVSEDGSLVETGETMHDAILREGPLPSDEVIREQIRRGPLGTLDTDGGEL